MLEQRRKEIVETEYAYLPNGLRCKFAGWKDPAFCCVHSAQPGGYDVSWEKVEEVLQRSDRRFLGSELYVDWRSPWLGCVPKPDDFQDPEDYQKLVSSSQKWWR